MIRDGVKIGMQDEMIGDLLGVIYSSSGPLAIPFFLYAYIDIYIWIRYVIDNI